MFLGHVAVGLAAKRLAPRTSTAVLLGAPLLVDLLWPFDRPGIVSFWLLIAVLVVSAAGNLVGPPPPSETGLAVFALILWLIPLWGIWIDRHREPGAAA